MNKKRFVIILGIILLLLCPLLICGGLLYYEFYYKYLSVPNYRFSVGEYSKCHLETLKVDAPIGVITEDDGLLLVTTYDFYKEELYEGRIIASEVYLMIGDKKIKGDSPFVENYNVFKLGMDEEYSGNEAIELYILRVLDNDLTTTFQKECVVELGTFDDMLISKGDDYVGDKILISKDGKYIISKGGPLSEKLDYYIEIKDFEKDDYIDFYDTPNDNIHFNRIGDTHTYTVSYEEDGVQVDVFTMDLETGEIIEHVFDED